VSVPQVTLDDLALATRALRQHPLVVVGHDHAIGRRAGFGQRDRTRDVDVPASAGGAFTQFPWREFL